MSDILCVTFDAHYSIAKFLADHYKSVLINPDVVQFSDGELYISFLNDHAWHEKHVIIIAHTAHPIHENLIKILLLVDYLRQRNPQKITLVLGYCAYARQSVDDGFKGHVHAVARMIQAVGVDELVVVEPHDSYFTSMFSIPVHTIRVHNAIIKHIQEKIPAWQECCIVAPDKGATERARIIAKALGLPLVECSKQRGNGNQPPIIGIHNYTGISRAILVDDIVDTGATSLTVAQDLRDLGVEKIYGYFVHGIFSQGFAHFEQLNCFDHIYISPTVPRSNIPSTVLVDYFMQLQDIENLLSGIDF